LLIGAALAFPLPALLTTHFGLPLGGIQIPTNSMQMFSLLFPIFIAVAIARHDLFAIGIIIQRTYGYVLSTRAIVGVYALLVTGLNVTFQSVEVTRSPWFSPAFALGVVFFFGPLHRRLQRFVNRVFYRQQYDYRKTIRDISETMIRLCSQLRHVFLWSRMLTLTTAPSTSGDRRVVLPLLGDGRITCDSGTYTSRWVGAQSMTRPARRHPMPLPSEGKPVSQESPLERQPPLTSTIRVSAQERDETVQRLQTAFVEGRLSDEEFDERVRAALAARTRVELERLLADLPGPYTRQAQPVRPAPVRRGESFVIAETDAR